MLILDGHGSYLTGQFDRICTDNNFITVCMPLDPEHVYQKLTVQLRTPTPPPNRPSNSQSPCLQTPQNLRQFKRQITKIKKRINEYPTSPLERVDQAIKRMSKAYEMSINELSIIQKEMHDLRAANEREEKA
jgi:hypothetical protein